MASPDKTLRLVQRAEAGDALAAEDLFPLLYRQLHQLATSMMDRERADHTLQPTALVNEAFLRLTRTAECGDASPTGPYQDLDHFVGTAAVAMRRILINHARAKQADKRGGGWSRVLLDDVADQFSSSAVDLLALDEALEQLTQLDPTQSRLVELRFFGGLEVKQCARILGISERAAYYEWAHARAWLKQAIEGEPDG